MSGQSLDELKESLFQNIRLRLGDGIVDIELDPAHLDAAYTYAIKIYRQRAQNSTIESYTLMKMEKDTYIYTLPQEFMSVRQVFRRTVGMETGPAASSFDPFSSAILNTYLLNYNYAGGLATYDMFAGYQKLVGKMFGSFIEFKWKPTSHILTILQRPFAQGEQILIQSYNYRPDFVLLQDIYAKQWLRDYTLATCKMMLGEARSLFASIAGPTGSIQLNGNDLKAAAKEELAALDKELENNIPGGMPYYFIIG